MSDADPDRKAVVIFRKDGTIVHVHEAVAAPGASLPPDAQLEADAFEMARRRLKGNAGDLAALHTRTLRQKRDVGYRVDVQRHAIVEVPRIAKPKATPQ